MITQRHPLTRRRHRALLVGAATLSMSMVTGCEKEQPKRQAPPPAPAPATCKKEPRVNDKANLQYVPPTTGAFCIDPNGSDRGFGEGLKGKLDGICDLFDGECEIYKRHGVDRVVEVRYVDGEGSPATIDLHLSRFKSSAHAYAMFTKRVVGDGDPAHPDTPKPLEAGGAGALGVGNAYVWRGAFLAELTFADEQASVDVLTAKSAKLLPAIARDLGSRVVGKPDLPDAAKALPAKARLPNGMRYVMKDVLGVKGAGEGAYGYYQVGEVRWRVVSIVREDAAQVEDVMKTLGKLPGAAEEKGLGDGAVRFVSKNDGPQVEWLVTRKDKRIVGIGDEPRVLREGMSADEHRTKTLALESKKKELKKLLDGQSD